jgi:hypothetical protein
MAAQRAVYYFRVARKIVHAVQARTLIRSESQSEKSSGSVRVCLDASLSSALPSDVSSRPSQRACPPTPAGIRLRAGAFQKPRRALAYLLSTLEIVRNVLRHEDVTPERSIAYGQSSFSFIDVLHSREMERLNLFGWRGLEMSQIAQALRSSREVEDIMLFFSRFEARAASPPHGEVYSDEARLAWSYA